MSHARGVFDALTQQPTDSLLALIELYRSDPRPHKIDVGVGVFRDDAGQTPVLRSVKAAEAALLVSQSSKSYLGAEGDIRFVELLAPIVFGTMLAQSDRLLGIQTPGGTGALRLGAELLARAKPKARIWMSIPTWPNHAPIFSAAGLEVEQHAFLEKESGRLDFDGMMSSLQDARTDDVLLLHGCCHNPCGLEFTPQQWDQLISFIRTRGLLPFIDLAYQGLGNGLEEDPQATRKIVERLPEALIAYSCDKNFGLYRERVGALWIQAGTADEARLVINNLLVIARSIWSMPPDHGAAIVRTILEDPLLVTQWRTELDDMRRRINRLRTALASAHPRLRSLEQQRGMFAMLPLSPEQIATLRERNGIYMAPLGRINIAGLRDETIAPFVAALAPYLDQVEEDDCRAGFSKARVPENLSS